MTDNTTTPPCILRFKKLKSATAIRRSARHTWRLDPVSYVDATRTHLNEDWRPVNDPESLLAAVEERLKAVTVTALRTESPVFCLEYLVTARRECFADHGGEVDAIAYFRDAVEFLERRHGADNVVGINIQNDEHAPHCVAYVVPLVERPARTVRRSVFARGRDEKGRQRREVREFLAPAEIALSADHYNGTPKRVSALQTRFAKEVANRHGLARGLEMSAATHTTNRAHHAALARAMAGHVDLTPEELERRGRLWRRESPEEHARRLSELIRSHYEPAVSRAATAEHDRRRAREMEETARRHRDRYESERQAHAETRLALQRLTAGLDPEQRKELEDLAALRRQANERAVQEERQRRAREEVERNRREQQRLEAERQARQVREEKLAAKLRTASPEGLARAELELRRECWRLLFDRPDLEEAADRMAESGLFEHGGHLSPKGQALVAPATEGSGSAMPNRAPSDPGPSQGPGIG